MLRRLLIALVCVGTVAACSPRVDRWRLETARPFLAGTSQAFTPAVSADDIFFCGGYSTTGDAALIALTADGAVRWRVEIGVCADAPVPMGDTIVAYARDRGQLELVLL